MGVTDGAKTVGVADGKMVGDGVGLTVIIGEGEIMVVGAAVTVGVKLAEAVASPKTTLSPLFNTMNFLVSEIGFPFLSYP